MTAPRPPRGRPRDPGIEAKVHAAALEVYAERGWSGFTLEAVARRAGVGQAALYRRWTGKAALLGDAVSARSPELPDVDTGSSAHDLRQLAEHLLASYREPFGAVGLRMVLDGRSSPELAEQFSAMLASPRAQGAVAAVRRAVDAGVLAPGSSTAVVLAVLTGATLSHVLFSPPGADPERDARFLDGLLQTLLAGGSSQGS